MESILEMIKDDDKRPCIYVIHETTYTILIFDLLHFLTDVASGWPRY